MGKLERGVVDHRLRLFQIQGWPEHRKRGGVYLLLFLVALRRLHLFGVLALIGSLRLLERGLGEGGFPLRVGLERGLLIAGGDGLFLPLSLFLLVHPFFFGEGAFNVCRLWFIQIAGFFRTCRGKIFLFCGDIDRDFLRFIFLDLQTGLWAEERGSEVLRLLRARRGEDFFLDLDAHILIAFLLLLFVLDFLAEAKVGGLSFFRSRLKIGLSEGDRPDVFLFLCIFDFVFSIAEIDGLAIGNGGEARLRKGEGKSGQEFLCFHFLPLFFLDFHPPGGDDGGGVLFERIDNAVFRMRPFQKKHAVDSVVEIHDQSRKDPLGNAKRLSVAPHDGVLAFPGRRIKAMAPGQKRGFPLQSELCGFEIGAGERRRVVGKKNLPFRKIGLIDVIGLFHVSPPCAYVRFLF